MRRGWRKPVALALAGALAAGLALLAGVRFGVLLPPVRDLVVSQVNGVEVGRFGRLGVEGVSGDLWRDVRVRRLTIRDSAGAWLEADDLRLRWHALDLLRRRFHARDVQVGSLRLIRRPALGPSGPPGAMPVSIVIDRARTRLEMLPAFSQQRGVYDVELVADVERRGGDSGHLLAASRLHPGDHLILDFDIAKSRPLLIRADAMEARGGALAGALGLPADRPFQLKVAAGGRTSRGYGEAVAISGASRPLEASGAWTPEGGEAHGRVSLTASSLTADYARRLGPEVRFTATGRKQTPTLFALDVNAAAENLTLKAQGLGDPGQGRLGPAGLAVAVSTPALSRITDGPQMGAARLAGVLTGDRAAWRFAGTAAVAKLALGAYDLDEASGPVELGSKAGAIDLKARIAGHGGRGSGWFPAFFGAAPRASLDASRLADGRLALRELDLVGAGVKVQASGSRGLLGGLSFKGEADLSNVAQAHTGAAGAARIAWTAAQARAGRPWTASLDARGDGFATGYPEIDRILGGRPRLTIDGNVQGRRLAITQAGLEGAAAKVAAAGVIDPDTGLALKLDWSAKGPFHAGPVEISGQAKGNGAVTGPFNAPRADLMAQVEAMDLPRLPLKNAHITLSFMQRPDGSSGVVALLADSGYGPARARSEFRFPEGGIDLSGLTVDAGGLKADGSLSLRRNAPSAADLTLAVQQGAFLAAGRITGAVKLAEAPGGPRASLNLAADHARFPGSALTLTAAKLSADGPLAHLPYALSAEGAAAPLGRFAADGRGVVSQAQDGYGATFEGAGRLGGRELRTVEPAVLRFGGAERSARLRLATADGGQVDLDGRLGDKDADIQARLAGINLGLFNEDLAGKMDGSLRLQGRGASLEGVLEAQLSGARGRGAPAASAIDSTIHGRLSGDTLTLDATAGNGQQLTATTSLVLPAVASAAPFRVGLDRERALSGRFAADGEVRPLFDLLIGGERSLSGRVRTEGQLVGTLAHPAAHGQITVQNGRFDDGLTGLSLRGVAMKAAFDQDSVDVSEASGVDGRGGSVTGSGRISLEREGASSFKLNLQRFRLIDNEQATALASGQATIDRRADGKVRLVGDLAIDHADVAARLPSGSGVVSMDVVEKNRPAELVEREEARAPPTDDGWLLDMRLRSKGGVILRGRGLNVELALDAHVGGTTSDPALSGVARVVRGDYDFAGKRFEFDPASTVYLASHAADIRLDLTARREDPTLTASVLIRGTAAKPEVSFASIPALPSDEVLSQVLFGQTAAQLSPLQAAQLASAVSSLARGGGLDVIGNLRSFARLDRLAFGGGTQGTAMNVAGGKYLTDNVYLELAGGGREGSYAQVQWQVRRTLSIISRVGGQGGSMLSFRWRRDY